jgi:hypothetical protein
MQHATAKRGLENSSRMSWRPGLILLEGIKSKLKTWQELLDKATETSHKPVF